jgi:hypothetical protein
MPVDLGRPSYHLPPERQALRRDAQQLLATTADPTHATPIRAVAASPMDPNPTTVDCIRRRTQTLALGKDDKNRRADGSNRKWEARNSRTLHSRTYPKPTRV